MKGSYFFEVSGIFTNSKNHIELMTGEIIQNFERSKVEKQLFHTLLGAILHESASEAKCQYLMNYLLTLKKNDAYLLQLKFDNITNQESTAEKQQIKHNI